MSKGHDTVRSLTAMQQTKPMLLAWLRDKTCSVRSRPSPVMLSLPRYGDLHYVAATWRKVAVVSRLVHWGFNVLHSDVDVVWFRCARAGWGGPRSCYCVLSRTCVGAWAAVGQARTALSQPACLAPSCLPYTEMVAKVSSDPTSEDAYPF